MIFLPHYYFLLLLKIAVNKSFILYNKYFLVFGHKLKELT